MIWTIFRRYTPKIVYFEASFLACSILCHCISDEPGILSTHLHADGEYESLLTVDYGVSTGKDKILQGAGGIQMKGNEVFKMAVNTLGRIVDETLAYNNMKKSDIDWLVPHQANIRIINATAKKLKMSTDHVVVTVNKHGNTSAASVPLALDVAVRDGRISASPCREDGGKEENGQQDLPG